MPGEGTPLWKGPHMSQETQKFLTWHVHMQFDGSEKSHPTSTATNPHPVCLWQMKCPREAGHTPVRKAAHWNWLILAWKIYQVPCDGCDAVSVWKKRLRIPASDTCDCLSGWTKAAFLSKQGHRKQKHLSAPVLFSWACWGSETWKHFGTQLAGSFVPQDW